MARLRLRFADPEDCARAKAMLAPESEGFLRLDAEGDILVVEVPEGSVGRALASVDDTLACLQTAIATRAAALQEKKDPGDPE